MSQSRSPRSFIRLMLPFLLSISSVVTTALVATPAHAASTSISGLSVFVGYAEDKETNTPNPATFPIPWLGAPNTIFLGGPVVGQVACHALLSCYDAGAIRLDNHGTSDMTIDNVSVDVHSTLPGGTVISLWGSFKVPAGKSVIVTENPPGNNPTYDNFDTSAYPKNNCVPITVAPTVTLTIGGVPTTLTDSAHVLDTGGIDLGSCSPKRNESIQWRAIGATGTNAASLTLTPALTSLPVGQSITETATLLYGGGSGLANANVDFAVKSGPNVGQIGSAITDQAGHASFTYADATSGTDVVVASVTSVGVFSSNQATVNWGVITPPPPPNWSGAEIGAPPLVGSDSLHNGVWTITGSGRDIGGTTDEFHYVSQPLNADGGISAQVVTQSNSNSRARAGVMLRQSIDPAAAFYAVVVTPGRGVFVLERATLGGAVSTVASVAGTAPDYLEVLRSGTTFTAYTSPDGTTWTAIPGSSMTLNLTGTMLAGMAVTSHTATKLSTATFDTVLIH